MYRHPYSSEATYTLDEAAEILAKTRQELEALVRNRKLGFELTDHGPVITNRHLAGYLLGEKPYAQPNYKQEKPRRKTRKRYVKARTRR